MVTQAETPNTQERQAVLPCQECGNGEPHTHTGPYKPIPVPDESVAPSRADIHLRRAALHMRAYTETMRHNPANVDSAMAAACEASLHTILAAAERLLDAHPHLLVGGSSEGQRQAEAKLHEVREVLGAKPNESANQAAERVMAHLKAEQEQAVAVLHSCQSVIDIVRKLAARIVPAAPVASTFASEGHGEWRRYTNDRPPRFGDIVRMVGETSRRGVVTLWTIGGASVYWEGQSGLTNAYSSATLEYLHEGRP